MCIKLGVSVSGDPTKGKFGLKPRIASAASSASLCLNYGLSLVEYMACVSSSSSAVSNLQSLRNSATNYRFLQSMVF